MSKKRIVELFDVLRKAIEERDSVLAERVQIEGRLREIQEREGELHERVARAMQEIREAAGERTETGEKVMGPLNETIAKLKGKD